MFYDPLSATFDDVDHSVGERRLITVGFSSQGRVSLYPTRREERLYVSSAQTSHGARKEET